MKTGSFTNTSCMCFPLDLSFSCLETHALLFLHIWVLPIALSMTLLSSHTTSLSIPDSEPTGALNPEQRSLTKGYFQTLAGNERDPLNWGHSKQSWWSAWGLHIPYPSPKRSVPILLQTCREFIRHSTSLILFLCFNYWDISLKSILDHHLLLLTLNSILDKLSKGCPNFWCLWATPEE